MATAIRGRLVRQTTKQPLQGIIIEAINVATGAAASSTTTTDTEGFYSLTGLTDATYFANPLVAGDDWIIQPDTNVLFGGAIYIPDDATTPRVQITNADFGGIVGLDTGDTYDDSDGSGTYQFLLSQNDGKAYFGGGDVVLDDTGIVVANEGKLLIDATYSGALTPPAVAIDIDVLSTGSKNVFGIDSNVNRLGTAGSVTGALFTAARSDANDMLAMTAVNAQAHINGGGGTITDAVAVNARARTVMSGQTTTDAYGVKAEVSGSAGTITTSHGVYIDVSYGTNQRGVEIAGPSSGANNYAIYSSATAQSAHAGNLRIGSTSAPTVALHVTGEGLFDESVNGNTQVLISNQNTGTAAGAAFNALVPATSTTGDAYFSATVAATKAWSWGLDNSDSDAWVLSENATLGTNNRLRVVGAQVDALDPGSATGGLRVLPDGIRVNDGSASAAGATDGLLAEFAHGSNAVEAMVQIINTTNSGSGSATLQLVTQPSSTGDAQVHFRVSGTQSWRIGVDNSASDALVISRGSGLGTNDVLSISTGDIITLANGVNIAVNTSTGTKIGTSTTQKLGFFNATPVVRQTAPAAAPAGGTGVAAGGWSSATNRDTAINCINGIRTALINLGLIG